MRDGGMLENKHTVSHSLSKRGVASERRKKLLEREREGLCLCARGRTGLDGVTGQRKMRLGLFSSAALPALAALTAFSWRPISWRR